MSKLLHIGLGKCGSKFLQREIFPKIAEKTKINYMSKLLSVKKFYDHYERNQGRLKIDFDLTFATFNIYIYNC